jgi:hypothetical protein
MRETQQRERERERERERREREERRDMMMTGRDRQVYNRRGRTPSPA